MVTTPLRMGIVGVGHLGRHHARIAATLPGVRLAAVADHDLARAQAAAEGTGASAVADVMDLVGIVDAAVVAVPTSSHLAVARPLLAAGVHVLVEKPIAATLDEADEMIRLAEAAGVQLAVGHSERFNPAMLAAWPVIHAPRFVEVHRLSSFRERSLDIDVVFDVMIHDLDIMLAVDTTDVVRVDAIGVPVLTPRVDIANARLTFASGCVANITASRISQEAVRKVRFIEPDMYVAVDYAGGTLEVLRLVRRPGARPAIEGGPVAVAPGEPLRHELIDFVESIRDRRPPRVTGPAGRRALALATRVAHAIEAASPTGLESHVR